MESMRLDAVPSPRQWRCAWLALTLLTLIGVATIALPAVQNSARGLTSRRHWRAQFTACPKALTGRTCGRRGAFDHLVYAAGRGSQKAPARRAIVSILQDETHLASVLTLAFSLREHGNVLPLVLFHNTTWTLSDTARDIVELAGWEIRTWERIAPFVGGTESKFMDTCAPLML